MPSSPNHHGLPLTHSLSSDGILSAQIIGVTSMVALSSLSCMLLSWQNDEFEDVTLDDDDTGEGGEDDDVPMVSYQTEEEYQRYVTVQSFSIPLLPYHPDRSIASGHTICPLPQRPSSNVAPN